MKYLPIIDLSSNSVMIALAAGQLKLQRGQWIRCNIGDKRPSRYVATRDGVIYASHWQGSSKETNARFKMLCSIV